MDLNLAMNADRSGQPYNSGEEKQGMVAATYERLLTNRSPALQRGRDASKVTIPGLIPEDGGGDRGSLKTPYQSLGARGVNYLASKLLISLFPPNSAFFKLEIDDLALRVAEQGPEVKAELDQALVRVENAVMTVLETANGRASLHEAFKHLLVGGNVLLYVDTEGIKVIHLNRYCVVRDPMGAISKIVIQEECYPEALPEDFLNSVEEDNTDEEKAYNKKSVKVYTCVEFEEKKCYWYQEAFGKEIPGTHGTCDKESSPWVPLRFNRVDGEEYGRGYVEEYQGDLYALEGLYQAMLEGAAASAKILFLCNPAGSTRPRTLQNAPNGSIVQGNAADVTVIQSQKGQDFAVVLDMIQRIEERLQFAFLLNTAIQRPGERVTAEEIRYMSQELEAGIGGLYSILTQELQLPLVRRLMHLLRKQKKLSPFPKVDGQAVVNPKPVTGLDAIGRGDDRNKLIDFFTTVGQALGADAMAQYVNVPEAIARLAASESIDTTNLIKTAEELEAEAQAAEDAQRQQMEDQQTQENLQAGMKSPAFAKLAESYIQQQQGGTPDGNNTEGTEQVPAA